MMIPVPDQSMIDPTRDIAQARLRVLLTTDLHMRLGSYNYFTGQEDPGAGLFYLAPRIEAARAAVDASLLLDGGDFLQGTPLADEIAAMGTLPHPMIAAFNHLRYDAVTLGNHEFEYGLNYLQKVIDDCHAPVVSTNVRTGPTDSFVAPWALIKRSMACSDGQTRDLTIGIIGFAPPQITEWSADILNGVLHIEDAISAALTHIPQVRRAGADIVIALCHGGPDTTTHRTRMENPASALAGLQGIDVVLMGHLHRTFPGPEFAHMPGTDCVRGTIHGTPAMMPSCHGKAFGQMDLSLTLDCGGNWAVADHAVQMIGAEKGLTVGASDMARALMPQLAAPHAATVKRLAEPICDTPIALTSYFAAIGRDETADLLARVQADVIRNHLRGTPFEALPVLSSTAPFAAGGHGGPTNYLNIQPGPVRLRDCTAMAPFDNPVCAVLQRGWQIRAWLERSAAYFNRLEPGRADQPLVSGHIASYHFDTIHGLEYVIDLQCDAQAAPLLSFEKGRIRDLTLNGQRLNDDTLVVVATNAYRARGGDI